MASSHYVNVMSQAFLVHLNILYFFDPILALYLCQFIPDLIDVNEFGLQEVHPFVKRTFLEMTHASPQRLRFRDNCVKFQFQ